MSAFERLHRLGAEAQRLSRVFTGSLDESASYEGHDEANVVSVVIDASGEVTGIRIARDWTDEIQPREFGGAVLDAVNAAAAERISAWADRIADADDREAVAEDPGGSTTRWLPTGPVRINPSRAMIDHMFSLLERVNREMRVAVAQASDDAADPVWGESTGGHVLVAVTGKQAVDVRIEAEAWIRRASQLELARELCSAFADAYARSDAAAAERAANGAVAELRALTADPQAFVASLFGLDR